MASSHRSGCVLKETHTRKTACDDRTFRDSNPSGSPARPTPARPRGILSQPAGRAVTPPTIVVWRTSGACPQLRTCPTRRAVVGSELSCQVVRARGAYRPRSPRIRSAACVCICQGAVCAHAVYTCVWPRRGNSHARVSARLARTSATLATLSPCARTIPDGRVPRTLACPLHGLGRVTHSVYTAITSPYRGRHPSSGQPRLRPSRPR